MHQQGPEPATDGDRNPVGFTSRREFLKLASAAAAAIGFPTIIPSRVLGADAPSNRIVMAGIGLGSQGRVNMSSFLGPGVQWIGVCDVDRRHLRRAKQMVDLHYGNQDCLAYEDVRDILDRKDIDAVSISTPDHWHAWPAVTAARKGMDVFCEKPIGHNLREGRIICNEIHKHGRVWQTGSWQRSTDNFQHAVELVRNGRLGKIARIEIGLPTGNPGPAGLVQPVPPDLNWEMWLGPAPWQPYRGVAHWDWRWVLDWAGGQLNDWIGHHCDIALWSIGMDHTGPTSVSGTGSFPTEGMFDAPTTYRIEVEMPNGISMVVADASQLEFGMGVRWIGENGQWIHVDRGRQSSNPASLWGEVIRPEETRIRRYRGHVEDFLECVRTRGKTIAPAEAAHRAFSVGCLGLTSMRLGRKLRWDPDSEMVIGDDTANQLLGRTPREPWSLV
jgi:predicted dehydrogenase